MRIYFAGSIRAGRQDVSVYNELIKYIKNYGEVLTEYIGDKSITENGEEGIDNKLTDEQIHDRDLEWILKADVLMAEVSTPSLGVGYEIRFAIENGKKVLCLYNLDEGKKLSAMISGSKKIKKGKYNSITEAKKIIDDFFRCKKII